MGVISPLDMMTAGTNDGDFTLKNYGDKFPAIDIPALSPHSSLGGIFNGMGDMDFLYT
jgi:hypothetical protein